MKTLGVIGGLGPMATAYFLEQLVKMTDAPCDQQHIESIIYHMPTIHDRTAYILNHENPNPLPELLEVIKKCEKQGCEVIAIPCVTAQYFYDDITQAVKGNVIHIIRETLAYLKKNGCRRMGIMATAGTVKSGLFQKEAKAYGIDVIVPDEKHQNITMEIIYDEVKANFPVDFDKFRSVTSHLHNKGAEIVVLGCTELSIAKKEGYLEPGLLDVVDVLAASSILSCGAKLKKEYQKLIT